MLDQSKVGKGFDVLMLSVRVDQRALPVLWTVQQTRGAIGFAEQRCLLEAVVQMLPASPVVLMADRFYGTPALVEWCQTHQWRYRIRLKGNLIFEHLGGEVTGKDAASWGMRALNQATFNNSAIQTNIGIVHQATHEEPWIIAMDCPASEYKALDYSWRWGIEAMFSDFKSCGFDLPRTQLQHAERIERLILVMSLALYWATSAGITDPAASPSSQKNASAPSVPSLQQGCVLSSELSAMLCQFSLSGYPGNLRGGEAFRISRVDFLAVFDLES